MTTVNGIRKVGLTWGDFGLNCLHETASHFPKVKVMLVPLDMLAAGDTAVVAEVHGACVERLAEMGLRAGCRLQMLQPGAPCLLQVENCKLCLRGTDCTQVLVQLVPSSAA
jgi:Fe2+ transport system protein FeoA